MTALDVQITRLMEEVADAAPPAPTVELGSKPALQQLIPAHKRPHWKVAVGTALAAILVVGVPLAWMMSDGTGESSRPSSTSTSQEVPLRGELTWLSLPEPFPFDSPGRIVQTDEVFFAVAGRQLHVSKDLATWTTEPLPDELIGIPEPTTSGGELWVLEQSEAPALWHRTGVGEWDRIEIEPPSPPISGVDWQDPSIQHIATTDDAVVVTASFWGSVPWTDIYPDDYASGMCCVVEASPDGQHGTLRTYSPGDRRTIAEVSIEIEAGDDFRMTFLDPDSGEVIHVVEGMYPGVDATTMQEAVLDSMLAYQVTGVLGEDGVGFAPSPWGHPHRWEASVLVIGDRFVVHAKAGTPTTLIDLLEPPDEWWTSEDGVSWRRLPNPPLAPNARTTSLVRAAGGDLLLTAVSGSTVEIWTSNGRTWTQVPSTAAPYGSDLAFTTTDSFIVAWGAEPVDGRPGVEQLAVWSSLDGTTWRKHSSPPPFRLGDDTRSHGVWAAGDVLFATVEDASGSEWWIGRFD
jgi:hypothetical protein